MFGTTFDCICGRTHSIEPRSVLIADDAVARLPGLLGDATGGRRVAVLMDSRTREAAGRDAAASLAGAGWAVQEIVIPDPGPGAWPACDTATRDRLAAGLAACDALLAVGAGVVNDLAKWLALDQGLPYVSLATAASMNGYASANIAPTIAGVKTLVHGRPPLSIAASLPILQAAPFELTTAGFGDILAKSVSAMDWRLNHLVFGDYYCDRSVGLISEVEPLYLERPEDVAAREPAAIKALFQALLLTGVAMTMAGTSAPASGGEHMISHTLDMMASRDSRAHDLHGRQVGLGTVLASALYAEVLAIESPSFRIPPGDIDRAFWGSLSPAVAAEHNAKQPRLARAGATLSQGSAWDDLRSQLAPMLRPASRIRDCLRRAGAAFAVGHIGGSPERLLAALLHAHEIRSRFTVLDLARIAGVLPGAARALVEGWA